MMQRSNLCLPNSNCCFQIRSMKSSQVDGKERAGGRSDAALSSVLGGTGADLGMSR